MGSRSVSICIYTSIINYIFLTYFCEQECLKYFKDRECYYMVGLLE